MGITSFTELIAWQKADQLRLEIETATENLTEEEKYELRAQLRTASRSIPTNIAEGFGRRHPRDKSRFYNMAQGSAEELKDHLIFGRQKGFLPKDDCLWNLLLEVCRLLKGLIRKTDEWARTGKLP